MKTFLGLSLLVVLATTAEATVGSNVGDRIPPFTAEVIDLTGAERKAANFDSQQTTGPSVYLFVGTQCPTTRSYLDRLRSLELAYAKQGVSFVYVYSNKTDSSEAKSKFHKDEKLSGAMIDDQGASVARAVGAQKTAEAVLVSKDGEILYRGAIDDGGKEPEKVRQRFVALALDEHLAGKPVTTKSAPVSA